MVSLTQWTWVWATSGSWWWTGKPGLLQSMGSQIVGHDWVTKLNWSYETNLPASRFTEESTCQWSRCWRCSLNPWIRKIPWRRKWQPIPVFLPQKACAQRNLEGYSPWSGRSWTWLPDSAHTQIYRQRWMLISYFSQQKRGCVIQYFYFYFSWKLCRKQRDSHSH